MAIFRNKNQLCLSLLFLLSFVSPSIQSYYSLTTTVSTVEPPNELTFIRSVVEEVGNFAAEKIYRDLPNRSPTTRLTLKKIQYEESIMSEAHYFSLLLSNSSSPQAYQLEMLDLLRPRAIWLGLPSPNQLENEQERQVTFRQLFERSLQLQDLTLPGPLELHFNKWAQSKNKQEISFRLPHEVDLEMKEIHKVIIDQNVEQIVIKNIDSVQLLSPLQVALRREEDSEAMQQVISLDDLERILNEDKTSEKAIFEWKETPKLVLGGRSIVVNSAGQRLKVKKKAEGVLEIFDPTKPRGSSTKNNQKRKLELHNLKKKGFLASLFSLLEEKGMESQLDGRTRGFNINFQQGRVEVVYYFLLPLVVELEEEQKIPTANPATKTDRSDSEASQPTSKKIRRTVQYRTFIMMSSDGSKKLIKYEPIVDYPNMISYSQSLLLNGTLMDAIPSSLKGKMDDGLQLLP